MAKYHVEISNRFAALENLDAEVDIKTNGLQHLNAVATVTLNMLPATRNEVACRLDMCRANKGTHIEMY
jgi:hypothetical protein